MIKKRVLSFCIFLVFSGCYVSPRPILRLESVMDHSAWIQGKEYFKISKKNIDFVIAYNNLNSRYFAFDIEIGNRSNNPILVSPETFFYNSYKSSGDNSADIKTTYALNPEDEILALDKSIEIEKADYASETRTDFLFSFIDVVSDVATLGQKTSEEIEESNKAYLEQEKSSHIQEARHDGKMKNLSAEKWKWAKNALRKTTLKNDQMIGGEVYFPHQFIGDNIELVFEIGDQLFKIPYKIKIHSPH